jgi:flagellar motor switch protein FliG
MAVQTESQRGLNLEVADSEMGNPAALPAVLGADGTTQPNLLDSLKAMLAGGRSGPVALTGPEKAAILIAGLGVDVSAEVLTSLSDAEIEDVVLALSKLQSVGAELRDSVFQEAFELSHAGESLSQGSMGFIRQLIGRLRSRSDGQPVADRMTIALDQWRRGVRGEEEPDEVVDPAEIEATKLAETEAHTEATSVSLTAIDVMNQVDDSDVAAYLKDEHPQAVALVIALMDQKKAGSVMAFLPPNMLGDVSVRIAAMTAINPSVAASIGKALDKEFASAGGKKAKIGGPDFLVTLLQGVDRPTEKIILEGLDAANPDLAATVKAQLFTFEDIAKLTDKSIQRIMRDVNKADLVVALKSSSADLQNKIWKNMSSRAAQMLQEELQFMPPTKLTTIYDAQRKVIDLVRDLEAKQEISIPRAGGVQEFA